MKTSFSTLHLYRRHSRKCRGNHPFQIASGEDDERKKGWKRCDCPITASGLFRGKFSRKSTGQTDWNLAREVVAGWTKALEENDQVGADLKDQIRALPKILPSVLAKDPIAAGAITIEKVGKAFLASHADSSFSTRRQYKYMVNALQAFADFNGFCVVGQWGPAEVREFRATWDVSPLTSSKKMATVKCFFEFALENEWIERNPARLVKNSKGRNALVADERLPFSDDELKRMYRVCDKKWGQGDSSGRYFLWDGQAMADFISVSTYTGLRISDVATFHIDRMSPNGDVVIRTTKTGKKVYTWVPEWLQERIRDRARTTGPYVFGEHKTPNINTITDQWRRRLKKLWALCGKWDAAPTPHRFRHTFARILLQQSTITMRDVAELLGNTETIVRKHYSAWVPERQERLSKLLREAFVDKPLPDDKVLTFPGPHREA